MGVGLGVTLLAATIAVIGAYAFFSGLTVEKFEKIATRGDYDKD